MKGLVWVGFFLFIFCGYKAVGFYQEAMLLTSRTGIYYEISKIAGFTGKAQSKAILFGFLSLAGLLIIIAEFYNVYKSSDSKNDKK